MKMVTIPDHLLQNDIFLLEVLFFEGISNDELDFIDLEGFGDIVLGPFFHGLDRCIVRGVGRDHDDDGFRREGLDPF